MRALLLGKLKFKDKICPLGEGWLGEGQNATGMSGMPPFKTIIMSAAKMMNYPWDRGFIQFFVSWGNDSIYFVVIVK